MHAPASPPLAGNVRLAIVGLGFTTIIGWGSTYFILSLLGTAIGRDLGLSTGALMAGISMTFITVALIGPHIGRWQDRAGSRNVMMTGTTIIAAGLILLATAQSAIGYYLAWAVISIGSPMALYMSAFTALSQIAGKETRRAISYLTLIGGLSSSICWPATAWMMQYLDWRTIVLIFAAIHVLFCLPLTFFVLDNKSAAERQAEGVEMIDPILPTDAQNRAFWMMATILMLLGFGLNGMNLTVFPLLHGSGFDPASAIFVSSLIGITQVGARFIEMQFASRMSIFWTGIIATFALPICAFTLLLASGNVALGILFASLFGAAQGLQTIARSGLVLVIFGSWGYGERIGRVTIAQNVASAASPILAGLLIDSFGTRGALTTHFLVGAAAFMLMLWLRAHCARFGLK